MITKFPTWIKVGWTVVYQSGRDDNFLLHLRQNDLSYFYNEYMPAVSPELTQHLSMADLPAAPSMFVLTTVIVILFSHPLPFVVLGGLLFLVCLFILKFPGFFSKSIKQYYSVCDISSFFLYSEVNPSLLIKFHLLALLAWKTFIFTLSVTQETRVTIFTSFPNSVIVNVTLDVSSLGMHLGNSFGIMCRAALFAFTCSTSSSQALSGIVSVVICLWNLIW